jgi:hypothetical protein
MLSIQPSAMQFVQTTAQFIKKTDWNVIILTDYTNDFDTERFLCLMNICERIVIPYYNDSKITK